MRQSLGSGWWERAFIYLARLTSAIPILFCAQGLSNTSWLKVEGRFLKNERGKTVILRGVNIADPEHVNLKREGKTAASLIELAVRDYGAKVIRLPVHPGTDGKTGFFVNKEAYVSKHLGPAIEKCRELGVYVIIDLHYVANYRGLWHRVSEFWRFIAPRYRVSSHVLFEIFNEPIYPNNWKTWRRLIAQPAVDLIRKHAPNNLIIVGGPEWSSNMSGAAQEPIKGSNIVYTAHVYPNLPKDKWDSNFGPVLAKFPVFVTEWGYEYAEEGPVKGTTSGFGFPFRNWLNKNGLSWTAWIFDNEWESRIFNVDWELTGGEFGMGEFIRDSLQ